MRKYYGIHHITHGRIDNDYKYLQYNNNLEFSILFNRKFILNFEFEVRSEENSLVGLTISK